MFQALLPLLEQVDLSLHLHREDSGDIRVVAVPRRTSSDEDAALFAPLSIVATPAELDAEFASIVSGFAEHRKSLSEQLQEAKTRAEAEIKEAQASWRKKADAAKKSAAARTGAQAAARKPDAKASVKAESAPGAVNQSGAGTPTAASGTPVPAKDETARRTNTDGETTQVAAQADSARIPATGGAVPSNKPKRTRPTVTSERFFLKYSRPDLQAYAMELLPAAGRVGLSSDTRPVLARKLSSAFASAYDNDGSLDPDTIGRLKRWAETHNAVPDPRQGAD
jgi:PRTRC genetic system protein E